VNHKGICGSMSSFSLLDRQWLPLRRRSGKRQWVAPHQIVDQIDSDPFVAPDWRRPDFDAATLEFLIGLLATTFAPKDRSDWIDLFKSPPKAEQLAAAFLPFARAFHLDGDGPRFMQEFNRLDSEPWSVSRLLIESPGANTEKKNADLFQKRGRVVALGVPAVAMALFTLQTYAPEGGRGVRASLRGGGPLTTLALPPEKQAHNTLWNHLWLNVPDKNEPVSDDLSRIFAWLAPTRTSEGKAPPIGPDDIHPLSVFWGMPRRITLDVETREDAVRCDITGELVNAAVASFHTRPWGMNYSVLPHPLSPMYRQKPGSLEWLYLHPQPGRLTYRHWIDMAASGDAPTTTRRPAPIIETARARLKALRHGSARLQATGYDMDNMKARGFVEATFPLFVMADENASRQLDVGARKLVEAASEAASLTVGAIGSALDIEGNDTSRLASIREDFFARTQTAYFRALRDLSQMLDADPESGDAFSCVSRVFFEAALRPTAFELFDLHAPLMTPGSREATRIIEARQRLLFSLLGYGKRGKSLFESLGLPPPESNKTKRDKASAA